MTTFSKPLLYQLRNEVDIHWLITEKLQLQRRFNKIWRFQCPLCGQFNTATQMKNNLARCFDCSNNFNTIDLVIYSKKLNFAPSVQFLLDCLPAQYVKSPAPPLHPVCVNVKHSRLSKIDADKAFEKMKQILR
jgi:hypothetical protein